MAFLELIAGRTPGARFQLHRERSIIGRSSECDFPLDVAAVSRRHAAIFMRDGQYFVEDLGSRNGTQVNGRRLSAAEPLSDGDHVQICDQTFEFRTDDSARAPINRLGSTHDENRGMFDPAQRAASATIGSAAEAEFDDGNGGESNVMATIDLAGGGSSSWRLSAKPEVKLAALVEISNNLGKILSVEEIMPKILESLFKIFVQADRGFVITKPDPEGPPVAVATKSRRESDEQKMRLSRTIVDKAMSLKKAILSADAASDERFGMAQSIADFQIRSMICAPMVDSNGESIGVIQLDTFNQRSRFTEEDLEVLAGVASQAAIAIDNARMHEQVMAQQALQRDLELAKRMQMALLPSSPPEVPGYHFFDYYQAARQVGGDYYDYIMLADGRVAVILGDVAGKGVSAALIMARLSSDVRFILASEPDAARAVTRINSRFASHDWQDRFVTMIVAVLDAHAHQLTLVNAGHMAPLLRRSDGRVEEIGDELSGLPLGVADEFEYESFVHRFEPGEFLTMFTDGFSEAMNGNRELYGLERLSAQVGAQTVSVAELGEHILEDVRRFVNGYDQSDDMCLACFGRLQ